MKSRASLQSILPYIKFVRQISTFISLMNVFSLKNGIVRYQSYKLLSTIMRVKVYTHIHNLLVIEALGDNSISHHSIVKHYLHNT